jgi:hypothetical protein
VSPTALSLAAAPASRDGANGPAAPVHVLGGEEGFDRVWVGGVGQEGPDSTGKASPVLFGGAATDSGRANGSNTVSMSRGIGEASPK